MLLGVICNNYGHYYYSLGEIDQILYSFQIFYVDLSKSDAHIM
jgi:hypothetical protein